jgi:hypothetical protein
MSRQKSVAVLALLLGVVAYLGSTARLCRRRKVGVLLAIAGSCGIKSSRLHRFCISILYAMPRFKYLWVRGKSGDAVACVVKLPGESGTVGRLGGGTILGLPGMEGTLKGG